MTINKNWLHATLSLLVALHAPWGMGAPFTVNTAAPDNRATVTDAATLLVWDRCAYGASNLNGTCNANARTYIWPQALAEVKSANDARYLGHADWRLPNVKELESIVDLEKSDPAIDTAAFPNTPSANFLTSTTYDPVASSVFGVYFGVGTVTASYKLGGIAAIRLVRGGQAAASYDALRLPQTLTFTPTSPQTYGSPLSLSPSSSDPSLTQFGYAVISGPCISANGLVRTTGVGRCEIEATQAGNETTASASAQATIDITPAPLTITARNLNKAQGQALAFAGTEFTASGLVNNEVVDAVTLSSVGADANATVGTYDIDISNATGGGKFLPSNYTITYTSGQLNVVERSLPPASTPIQVPLLDAWWEKALLALMVVMVMLMGMAMGWRGRSGST